ncbi:hypothetical protein GGS23DRAFT_597328 [Durotheca rogersii]|uniref:uncharacterized protein n=1 Tax=Durotheca rogersii TaxID=419775 RepID=UPI00221F1070|nr:uncharacterized protein GGS23DRAFT_597328 [Durotheca rogersii]KAI5862525.1 hypothetical protein GGS23DRAFT_597328 [Durotheca rogersii]
MRLYSAALALVGIFLWTSAALGAPGHTPAGGRAEHWGHPVQRNHGSVLGGGRRFSNLTKGVYPIRDGGGGGGNGSQCGGGGTSPPFVPCGGGVLTALCCSWVSTGVYNRNCNVLPQAPTSLEGFIAICARMRKNPRCCLPPTGIGAFFCHTPY